jgi:hypothetical protein
MEEYDCSNMIGYNYIHPTADVHPDAVVSQTINLMFRLGQMCRSGLMLRSMKDAG